MTEFPGACSPLLAALAQDAAGEGTGVRQALRLLELPELWIVVLILAPLAAAVAWIGYARESVPERARWVLASLRFGALALLLLVIFRPAFVQRREEIKPAEVLVLMDDSASMQRSDAYGGDAGRRDKLSDVSGLNPERASRSELARRAVERHLLPHLAEEGYQARLYRLDAGLEPLADLDQLAARGHATHVGDALAQALTTHRGRHVTDIVIVSDGRSNGGLVPLEAARSARASGIPVHTLVVGDTRPERNAIVELIEVPPSALEGDEIAVSVRVTGRGTQAGERARVVLEELSDGGPGDGGEARPVAEEEATLDDVGERVVLFAPPEPGGDGRPTERRFRVRVPPVSGETLTDDNAVVFTVRITPEKIRVLYVDGYPRWEYRYLKNLLLRADANLEVHCFLLSATPDFPQETTRSLTPLLEVPTDRKTLLEDYDVVVLGDVNPYAVSLDPRRAEEFMLSLREFVERGGGLIFLAGQYDNPRAFVRTPLEELLPVQLDATGALTFEGDTTREFRAVLEDPANPHEVVRLHPDAEVNRALWEDEGGLRGFYWYQPVLRAKPGAQTLLRHPSDQNAYGRFPLLVAGYFPAGRTLFMGVDETWRWRYRYGDRYHERFWRNAIRWVALGRLKSGDRRSQLDALRPTYNLDERVTLEARVLDEDYRPSDRAAQAARLAGPEGEEAALDLTLVEGRPGLYRVTFEVEDPGLYRAWIELDGQRSAGAEFEVVLPSRENADPSPDPQTMRAIASMTGGVALELSQIQRLVAQFPGDEERREPISSELDDAWDHWGTLLLALALLSAEWILRKRMELI
jgi:uncharacterized membrane protein